jgi:hypothetical protein
MTIYGQMFYKRLSDGVLVPINIGPEGPQGPTGEQGPAGPPGPATAQGGITQVDADNRYINADGDAMLGDLSLAGMPGEPDHAASKEYVDQVFASQPPVTLPTTYREQASEAGDPTDDPSLSTAVHALPYPDLDDGLRTARALELLAETLDLVIPIVLHGTSAPPEPASDYPEGTVYLRTEI